ncbi:ATP-binding SpoIIE family protein phosphatase [Streptomyces sp. WM4235]|uniref:ATP-binding SpoIIE family protein phosphatase n=1 Tax=Streptomyces sp. WM4235 TaxID=1415551 RepID=UPI0006AE506E|nr:SpoIIE family protein phosphatase [Streptomyces sp. WM4235]
MGPEADAFLCDLARGLRSRVDQLADVLTDVVRNEFPDMWQYEDVAALVQPAAYDDVTCILAVLEHRVDVTAVETPPASIEFARLVAEHGVPLSELLRLYRLSHAGALRLLHEEAASLSGDSDLTAATFLALTEMSFQYVDRISEQVVVAYQEERDRQLQRRLIMVNEAGARIGTTLDTARTARELADLATSRFADLVNVDLLEAVLLEEDALPAPGSSALRRIARSSAGEGFSVEADDFPVEMGQAHTYPEGSDPSRALATGQPSRHDFTTSETPSWLARSPGQGRTPRSVGAHSVLLVPLCARGSTLGLAQFLRYRDSESFDNNDLLLASEIASRAAVAIDNARRYTHERSTALTLQRSLLPQRLPEQPAVETAYRYLPSGSRAGAGGDWYDVIPLSGSRVALVVGDVVGRGLAAAATMGRLRTAVRTLADIDLMPDELLTHLDDVVIRLQREGARDADEISATCLYAVYDPVSSLCSLASAGHVPPAVAMSPALGSEGPASRSVDFPAVPIGPPLGLGGFPFETAQFELPPGSLLALYTDGLIEDRDRDVDSALALLRDVLSHAPASLEDTCDRLLSTLLPSHPLDDIALLVARTRALDAERVATLNLPSDPAVVSKARAYTSEKLAAWGLEELAFTTELMVSELVTNAIRYGKDPIRLRLIFQSTLVCEVSDSSSTAPHLRRARTFDEGGRGLLLVAQMAEHWGTRHSREGKVIWAEQSLPPAAGLKAGGLADVPQ